MSSVLAVDPFVTVVWALSSYRAVATGRLPFVRNGYPKIMRGVNVFEFDIGLLALGGAGAGKDINRAGVIKRVVGAACDTDGRLVAIFGDCTGYQGVRAFSKNTFTTGL